MTDHASMPFINDNNDILSVNFTIHGRKRMEQRNISEIELSYVLRYGTYVRKTGVDFVILRRRDIPREDRVHDTIVRLEGVVVLLSSDSCITTVYRNRNALRAIRKKRKDHCLAGVSAP